MSGPRGQWRAILPYALVAGAAVLLLRSLRPGPQWSLAAHWSEFGWRALPAVSLFALGAVLAAGRGRLAVILLGAVALGAAALAHPVCVAIPEMERPAYESVLSLAERAERGEPFCRVDGAWYQCKSFLSRAFFF